MTERKPFLSWEQHLALFREMRPPHSPAVMAEARETIAVEYYWFARKMANEAMRNPMSRKVDRDDLLGEALVTLMVAIDRFDPDRGLRFSTYLGVAIRSGLNQYVFVKGGNLEATTGLHAEVLLFRAARKRLAAAGKPSGDADVCRELRWGPERMARVADYWRLRSRGWLSTSDDNAAVLGLAAREDSGDDADAPSRPKAAARVAELLEKLHPEQRENIVLRYGLCGHAEHSLAEISRVRRVTQGSVSRSCSRALATLRRVG